ncbi:MAG: hypothetical protein AAF465_14370 [Pseudomonadota bacterium]
MRCSTQFLIFILTLVQIRETCAYDIDAGALTLFGTPRSAETDGRGADRGLILKEGVEGFLWVSGIADARVSDTGGHPGRPLFAKFGPDGSLLWQQIYDRPGWSIIGIDSTSKAPALIFFYPEPGRWFQLNRNHESYFEHGRIELWTTTPNGELKKNKMTFHHRVKEAVVSTRSDGFTLMLGTPQPKFLEQDTVRVATYHYDWNGDRAQRSSSFELTDFPDQLADKEGALSSQYDGLANQQTNLLYHDLTTSRTFRRKIVNCSPCRFRSAVRTQRGIVALVTKGDWQDPHRTAFIIVLDPDSRKITARVEMPELAYLENLRIHAIQSGDLIFSGVDYLATVVVGLSGKDYSVDWAARFRPGLRRMFVTDIIERPDGQLAIIGSDSESNAVLVTGHPEGKFLTYLGRCNSPGLELARLQHQLAKKRRVKLHVDVHYTRRLIERQLSSVDASITGNQCDKHGEADLIGFGDFLLNTPIKIDAMQLSEKSMITIKTMRRLFEEGGAFRYVTPVRSSNIPTMFVDPNKAGQIADELEESVLPHMREIEILDTQLSNKMRHLFYNGNTHAQSLRHHEDPDGDQAISPAEYVEAIRILLRKRDALDKPTRSKIARSVDRVNVVALVPGKGLTRRVYSHVVELPLSNVDDYWDWLQGARRVKAIGIFEVESRLRREKNIVFVNTPEVDPADYLAFLNRLLPRLSLLNRSALTVQLKFTKNADGAINILFLNSKPCVSWESAGLNADNLATTLQQNWDCIRSLDRQFVRWIYDASDL